MFLILHVTSSDQMHGVIPIHFRGDLGIWTSILKRGSWLKFKIKVGPKFKRGPKVQVVKLCNFLSLKNLIFHYVWVFLLSIKIEIWNYWSKTPDMFSNCLIGISQVKNFKKFLKIWRSLKTLYNLSKRF